MNKNTNKKIKFQKRICFRLIWWSKLKKMVFESIVIKVLNKYIGKYLKNFDANNLSIGLWSGMIHIIGVLRTLPNIYDGVFVRK